MAHIYRLISFCFLFFGFANSVFAIVPQITEYAVSEKLSLGYFPSKASACSAAAPANTETRTYSMIESDPACKYSMNGTPWISWGYYSRLKCPENSLMVDGVGCHCYAGFEEKDGQCKRPSCPEGQHEEGGACVPDKCKPNEVRIAGICVPEPDCPEGQTRVNGECKPAKCPKAGTFAGEYKVSSNSNTSFCEGGCTISITSFVEAFKDGKVVDRVGMGFYTGNECNGPSDPPDPDKPDPDDPGDGDDNTGGGNTGGGNTGGGGTGGGGTGGGGTGGGGNGGGGDSPPVKCPNGSCTGNDGGSNSGGTGGGSNGGTGTVTNPDGTCPAGSYKAGGKCWPKDPPEQDPDDDGACPKGYAKVNGKCVPYQPPEDDEDDKPGTFGGSCTGSFACEGDAIQCAIAKEQHRRNCKLFDEKSAESDLYNAHKGKEGDQTKDLPGNETINLSNRIDTSDALGGGGSGVQDLNITVMGQSITLPFSKINTGLDALGQVLLAVSFLIAFRIVGRG